MGASGNERVLFSDFDKMPNKSYICMEKDCEHVPEIKYIDINKYLIEIECIKHERKYQRVISIEEFINRQYEYINCKCAECHKFQKDCLTKKFSFCYICKKKFCEECLNKHDESHFIVKFNEKNNYCDSHNKSFYYYCQKCKKNMCQKCTECKCEEDPKKEIINPSKRDDIKYLKEKKEELLERKTKIEKLINLLDIIIENVDLVDKTNYFYRINASNVANSIKAEEGENLKNKNNFENTEKIIIDYLNESLNLKKMKSPIKGDEKKLDLNNKLNDQFNLKLFSLIEFPNLKELILSNNRLTDLNLLNNFNLSKTKILDLSNNEINDLSPLKDLSKNAFNLEQLFLNNNKIENASILKKRYFEHLRKINLDGNEISQKEIENISGLDTNKFRFVYEINKEEFSYENKIRIFGDVFVRNNKKNCKIIIN